MLLHARTGGGARLLIPLALAVAAALTMRPASAEPTVASSGDMSLAIIDRVDNNPGPPPTPYGVTETTITVPATVPGNITDLNLNFRITHTKDGNLDVFLIHPDGTKAELFSDVGAGQDNFGSGATNCSGTFTTLDTQAPTFINNGTAPFNGTYAPELPADPAKPAPLAKFNGKPKAGTWKLRIEDDENPDVGTLHCWQLVFAEGDGDGDGIFDSVDNCPTVSNPGQQDSDGDGRGDACDGDTDGDGVLDPSDNCPAVANPTQLNTDGDGMGDACDPDDDNDTVIDGSDNCPLAANTSQTNSDSDPLGDACDLDDDNDGLSDTDETARGTDPTNPDSDTDGLGDGAEVHVHGSDPRDRDTDGDLFADDTEVAAGSDPANPLSVPAPTGPVTVTGTPPVEEVPVTDSLEPVA